MFTEYCKNYNIITPVKKHCYENVFNYEFNILFFSPKNTNSLYVKNVKILHQKLQNKKKFMKNIKKSKTVARNEIDKDMHLIK
jgi:hypothetical protein